MKKNINKVVKFLFEDFLKKAKHKENTLSQDLGTMVSTIDPVFAIDKFIREKCYNSRYYKAPKFLGREEYIRHMRENIPIPIEERDRGYDSWKLWSNLYPIIVNVLFGKELSLDSGIYGMCVTIKKGQTKKTNTIVMKSIFRNSVVLAKKEIPNDLMEIFNSDLYIKKDRFGDTTPRSWNEIMDERLIPLYVDLISTAIRNILSGSLDSKLVGLKLRKDPETLKVELVEALGADTYDSSKYLMNENFVKKAKYKEDQNSGIDGFKEKAAEIGNIFDEVSLNKFLEENFYEEEKKFINLAAFCKKYQIPFLNEDYLRRIYSRSSREAMIFMMVKTANPTEAKNNYQFGLIRTYSAKPCGKVHMMIGTPNSNASRRGMSCVSWKSISVKEDPSLDLSPFYPTFDDGRIKYSCYSFPGPLTPTIICENMSHYYPRYSNWKDDNREECYKMLYKYFLKIISIYVRKTKEVYDALIADMDVISTEQDLAMHVDPRIQLMSKKKTPKNSFALKDSNGNDVLVLKSVMTPKFNYFISDLITKDLLDLTIQAGDTRIMDQFIQAGDVNSVWFLYGKGYLEEGNKLHLELREKDDPDWNFQIAGHLYLKALMRDYMGTEIRCHPYRNEFISKKNCAPRIWKTLEKVYQKPGWKISIYEKRNHLMEIVQKFPKKIDYTGPLPKDVKEYWETHKELV